MNVVDSIQMKLPNIVKSVSHIGEFPKKKKSNFSGYQHTPLSQSTCIPLQSTEHPKMVFTSISTPSSSFLSDSLSPSTSISNSTLFRNTTFPSFLVGFPKPPFSNATLRLKPLSSSASSTQQDNGSPEQFLKNTSIADFMRFKKGIDGATGVLQTAVVSYKKKFPWTLLNPFLKVV